MIHEFFWMVWREGGTAPTFKHNDMNAAAKEAERLARLNPGETFHVMECIASCAKTDVNWSWGRDDIPF